MRERKLFAGRKIRDIRRKSGLTQAAFAQRLGISTSYQNQIENNQRHVTASVLLALAETFAVDIASLSDAGSDRLLADMTEAFADPVFAGRVPAAADLKLVVQNAPSIGHAIVTMHHALQRTGEQLAELDDTLERSGALNEPTPYEEVRDFFHYRDNYIDDLDVAGEAFAETLATETRTPVRALADHIENRHRVRVVIGGADAKPDVIRHFDPRSRVLTLNPVAQSSSHAFQIAHQIALLEHRDTIDTILKSAEFRSPDASGVCRSGLANYFAGCVILPYRRFSEAARELRYDLHLLADRFGASIEQIGHRLSTLQRPGRKGIPFFFARVDRAGNITKRHSATKMQFARFGSACPLWNVHRAFEAPNAIIRQMAETPDGVRYLCLATTVTRRGGGYHDPAQHFALALGCELEHAEHLVYGDDLDTRNTRVIEPIGVSCRICERTACHQRAVPPLKRRIDVDPDRRAIVPYAIRS